MSDLQLAFEKFDRENPAVWGLFCDFANKAANAGHTTLSSSLIFERIRWETTVVTRCDAGFKLSNNHKPYYARKWNRQNQGNGMPLFVLKAVRGDVPVKTDKFGRDIPDEDIV